MADYLKRSHFFADFHAEGSISTKQLNPILMGRPQNESLPDSLGSLNVSLESSRFNNGNGWFYSTAPETGLFVIRSIKQAQHKIVTPMQHHARLAFTDTIEVYGNFIHLDPSAYSGDNLAHGMPTDPDSEGVIYNTALLTVHDYSDPAPIIPITIQKLNALPNYQE